MAVPLEHGLYGRALPARSAKVAGASARLGGLEAPGCQSGAYAPLSTSVPPMYIHRRCPHINFSGCVSVVWLDVLAPRTEMVIRQLVGHRCPDASASAVGRARTLEISCSRGEPVGRTLARGGDNPRSTLLLRD